MLRICAADEQDCGCDVIALQPFKKAHGLMLGVGLKTNLKSIASGLIDMIIPNARLNHSYQCWIVLNRFH